MSATTAEQGPAAHLLVAGRGPWTGPGARRFLDDAAALARSGRPVQVLLIADAVASAVVADGGAADAVAAGVDVVVDEFSLAQRGLAPAVLPAGVRRGGVHVVARAALDPTVQVVWH